MRELIRERRLRAQGKHYADKAVWDNRIRTDGVIESYSNRCPAVRTSKAPEIISSLSNLIFGGTETLRIEGQKDAEDFTRRLEVSVRKVVQDIASVGAGCIYAKDGHLYSPNAENCFWVSESDLRDYRLGILTDTEKQYLLNTFVKDAGLYVFSSGPSVQYEGKIVNRLLLITGTHYMYFYSIDEKDVLCESTFKDSRYNWQLISEDKHSYPKIPARWISSCNHGSDFGPEIITTDAESLITALDYSWTAWLDAVMLCASPTLVIIDGKENVSDAEKKAVLEAGKKLEKSQTPAGPKAVLNIQTESGMTSAQAQAFFLEPVKALDAFNKFVDAANATIDAHHNLGAQKATDSSNAVLKSMYRTVKYVTEVKLRMSDALNDFLEALFGDKVSLSWSNNFGAVPSDVREVLGGISAIVKASGTDGPLFSREELRQLISTTLGFPLSSQLPTGEAVPPDKVTNTEPE